MTRPDLLIHLGTPVVLQCYEGWQNELLLLHSILFVLIFVLAFQAFLCCFLGLF